MTERTFTRVSPLQDVAVQGRFGADKGAPGVSFTVRHPMSIVTVIARAGQGAATAAALKGYDCAVGRARPVFRAGRRPRRRRALS